MEAILLLEEGYFDHISLIIMLESPMTIKLLIPISNAKSKP
jgi:hypothetical protein